jgi:putative hydrolase of the HAD superfamily
MINVVVFDLDDTLFPEKEFVLSGFQAVDNWVLQQYSISGFYEFAKQLFIDGKRGNIFNITLEQLEIKYDIGLIEKLVWVYRSHKPNIKLYEDAVWAIKYLNSHKLLGIITDGFLETQRNKVAALEIVPYLSKIIYSDEYGREFWKPSQKPYLKLMESLGCLGSECVYIGDNPAKDFVAAKKMGWKTIRIFRKNGEYSNIIVDKEYQADFEIFTLFELKKLVV